MENTSHFACLCKMCLYREWLLLETEINNVVFGHHQLRYGTYPFGEQPTKTLGKSAAVSSPVENKCRVTKISSVPQRRSTALVIPTKLLGTGRQYPAEYERKGSPGVPQVNICVPPRPTAKRQKKTQADLERPEPPRCKRLHVSNVPFWFEDHHLIKLFQGFGNVVQAEVIYNDRGSKGFGFVTFENEDESENIRKLFNGLELHGRVIEVNYASKKRGHKNRGQTPKNSNALPDKPKIVARHQVVPRPPRPERAQPCSYCKSVYESRPRSSYLQQQQK